MPDLDAQLRLLCALFEFELALGGELEEALERALARTSNLPGRLFQTLSRQGAAPLESLSEAAAQLDYLPLRILAVTCAARARGAFSGSVVAGALACTA